jgi:hypothetical protein
MELDCLASREGSPSHPVRSRRTGIVGRPGSLFDDPALPGAPTPRSYVNEHPKVSKTMKRLEFLGDAST